MRHVPKSKSVVPYFGSDFLMLLACHSEELSDEALSGLRDALRLLDALPDDEDGLRAELAHEVATLLYQRHEDGDVDGFDVAPDYLLAAVNFRTNLAA